ncbi:hypothetical protein DKX38_016741 [Salix brachista]|uniref:Uncharacterized protein n=1 Tax=Salix brachista TaxID=2182728 RepID=A0A5N5KTF8_9ROSI|nr:hypothetical protein DKX38_016741 [Salix brachista]
MDKGDPIPPPEKGKSIQIDNTPTLVDEGTSDSDNLQEANFCSKIGSDSVVSDSQPIGLCGLNTNAPIPSNCDTIESTKSLNSDGRSLEFKSHPRILTRRNSEGDVQSHFIKKDLGKKNLNADFNEIAIAKVTDAFHDNDGFND